MDVLALRPCSQQLVKQVDRLPKETGGELWPRQIGNMWEGAWSNSFSRPEGVSHQALVFGARELLAHPGFWPPGFWAL